MEFFIEVCNSQATSVGRDTILLEPHPMMSMKIYIFEKIW